MKVFSLTGFALALAVGGMVGTSALAQSTMESCKAEMVEVRMMVAQSCMASEDQDRLLEDLIDGSSMCNTERYDEAAELFAAIKTSLGAK